MRSRWGSSWVLAFCLFVWAGPAQSQSLDLKRTDRSHMFPPPPDSILSPYLDPGSLPQDFSSQYIIKKVDAPLREAATLDTEASNQCRYRNFAEKIHRQFAVQFADKVLPGGPKAALIDINGIAEDDLIYVFEKFNTTRCTVYSLSVN